MRSWFAAAVLLAVWGGVSAAAAQGKKGTSNHPPAAPRANRPNPVKELERFQKMSPAERDKQLAKLPPQRREQLERRLAQLENMPPAQRQRVMERLQRLQELPPDRRVAVRQELQELRALPPAERRNRLNVDSEKFSPEELKLLRESSGQPELL